MGCGASKAVNVNEAADITLKANGFDTSPNEVLRSSETSSFNSGELSSRMSIKIANDEKSFPIKSENNERSLTNGHTLKTQPCDEELIYGKTPGNMDLQGRLRILSARRRSLQFEIGRDEHTSIEADSNSINLVPAGTRRSTSLLAPSQEFPKRKSIFPPPPPRNEHSPCPPFRSKPRLSLTDSQKEFFRMLDEKIEQGKDYTSEDEKSISSLVSRRGNRRLSSILDALRSQHAR